MQKGICSFNRRAVVLVLSVVTLALFNNCAATHSDSRNTASSISPEQLKCLSILEAEFQDGYYPFLQSNCAACHRAGGSGNGAFADSLGDVAYNAFKLRGHELIQDRALDPNHQSGITGPQHASELGAIQTAWEAALVEEAACEASIIQNDGDDPDLGDDLGGPSQAQFFTISKTISATNNSRTMTWNLSTEFETAGAPALAGVEFSMNVQRGQTPTGETYYQFSLPRLRAGTSNIRVAYIQIKINNAIENGGTTYKGISYIVGANQTRDLTLTNMIVPREVLDSDTLSIGFGVIEVTTEAPGPF